MSSIGAILVFAFGFLLGYLTKECEFKNNKTNK